MAPKRDKKGRFLKGSTGNRNGRPKKPYRAQLEAAIQRWEKKNDTSLFDHYVALAADDPPTMRDLVSKFIPSLKVIEMPKDETGAKKYAFAFVEYDGSRTDSDKA